MDFRVTSHNIDWPEAKWATASSSSTFSVAGMARLKGGQAVLESAGLDIGTILARVAVASELLFQPFGPIPKLMERRET